MIEPGKEPSISIAMCTYNGSRYLAEQLYSIRAQTRSPLELVVCDDGSSDDTIAILQNFKKDANFEVRLYENEEQLGSTRNFDRAMRLCLGDYIALSDQDDRWRADKLERLGEELDRDETVGMVFSDARLIDESSATTGETLWNSLRFQGRARSIFRQKPERILLERPVVTGATMLFRADLLQRFAVIPQNWVHDGWLTWMSVLWLRPLAIEQTYTDYRIHSGQQLGVGKVSFLSRMKEIQTRQRTQYSKVALELQNLLQYMEESELSSREGIIAELKKTIVFLKARAEAPQLWFPRLLFLITHVRYYKALSGPTWRSLSRDLLMGRPKG